MVTENNEPDIDWEDQDDEDETISCWVCNSCGKSTSDRPAWGGQCPCCGCIMEEEFL